MNRLGDWFNCVSRSAGKECVCNGGWHDDCSSWEGKSSRLCDYCNRTTRALVHSTAHSVGAGVQQFAFCKCFQSTTAESTQVSWVCLCLTFIDDRRIKPDTHFKFIYFLTYAVFRLKSVKCELLLPFPLHTSVGKSDRNHWYDLITSCASTWMGRWHWMDLKEMGCVCGCDKQVNLFRTRLNKMLSWRSLWTNRLTICIYFSYSYF
jgi:hypothetical protein